MTLADLKFDALSGGFTSSVRNRKRIRGGFSGRNVEATIVRRPDFADGRINRDGLGIGHVIAELCGFTATHERGRNVESADGQFRTAKLFDGSLIFFATLFGGLLGVVPLVISIGFVAIKEKNNEIADDGAEDNSRVEIRILEDGFCWGS